ncbi:hypothetical protein Q5741_02905 [Paenibacillus sp. JX-17]|uniref:Uncharacterized protein n=1 Tax=Paenibacillus lacisoli TaxID=3064525 RepID=A0ABT9C7W6_9BACL|nr:hypothetical protein [Paenibacillus sp. JX-17]MDO7905360.1 hypothetical protein [Paenibacillus sp. JX-17]
MIDNRMDIKVMFTCTQCGQEVSVPFNEEDVAVRTCPACKHTYSIMKPVIGEEILLDWHQEALIQKLRADKTEEDKVSLMRLVVKVIELLTWRDKGNGQTEAIEAMREWLIFNGIPKPLTELIVSNENRQQLPKS